MSIDWTIFHWQEFEKLCQSLLKATLGVGIEAWGGSGDWGIDAYCQSPLRYPGSEIQNGPFQFQAKYIQGANAAGARPAASLIASVRRECARIKERGLPTPNVYSLLTNSVVAPSTRQKIENLVRAVMPDCASVVVHGGNDICAWLHNHRDVANIFPQLLTSRDLVELVRISQSGKPNADLDIPAKIELSVKLTKKKKLARTASQRHNHDSAIRLWNEVRRLAAQEGNKVEEIAARLQVVLCHAWQEPIPKESIRLAEDCLREVKDVDLGAERCRLLQLMAEAHRHIGDLDKARGLIVKSLEHARSINSLGDQGFAFLLLAVLEQSKEGGGDQKRIIENIDLAYDAFTALFSTGDKDNQVTSNDGFAQCHLWKANILGTSRPDEALVEWTRALALFRSLGNGWEWNVADTILSRAELNGRLGETQNAASDFEVAMKTFLAVGDLYGVAKCHLSLGEFADRIGNRKGAAVAYHKAVEFATMGNNERRASYFWFRYTLKLAELQLFGEAKKILDSLASAEWLERGPKLDVIQQLCLVTKAMELEDAFQENCTRAISLVDEISAESTSANQRRKLIIRKAGFYEQAGKHDLALEHLERAKARLDDSGDQVGVIECWFAIRGVKQHLNDKIGEREAIEKVLALDAERLEPMFAALSLVMLAQMEMSEKRFSEAKEMLERAEKLGPTNPVVLMMSTHLRSELPSL